MSWSNERAYANEQYGLELSLGGYFEQADIVFCGVSNQLNEEDVLERGHLKRDWVRVHAGLGRHFSRDASLSEALELHDDAWSSNRSRSDCDVFRFSSEYGASLAVAARVDLADHLDEGGSPFYPNCLIDDMAENYQRAIKLLDDDKTNQNYRRQALSHGSLSLTGYGGKEHEDLRDSFIEAGSGVEHDMNKNQRRAMIISRYASSIKPIRGLVRLITAKEVAGPYRIAR